MCTHGVGSVVIEPGDRPVGIVTDRDVALMIGADQRSPTETTAREMMSSDLVTVDVDDGVSTVCREMSDHGVRRMPVMDGEELIGILTLDDPVVLLEDELGDIASVIESETPSYD